MIIYFPSNEKGNSSHSRYPQRTISGADASFLFLLKKVKNLPDNAFWKECFSRSKASKKFCQEKMFRLGQMASDCGEEYAEKYRKEFSDTSMDMEKICLKNGITVHEFAMQQSPAVELFGFFEAPNIISVRANLLQECDSYVKSTGISTLLDSVSCSEVLLAHEFFHFLEYRHEQSIITYTYTEPQGFFAKQQRVEPLSEIAAMSFAKHLLELNWNPFLLDCVMMSMNNMPAATVIAERLLHCSDY